MDVIVWLNKIAFLLTPQFIALLVALSVWLLWLGIVTLQRPDELTVRAASLAAQTMNEEVEGAQSPLRETLNTAFLRLLHTLGQFGPKQNLQEIQQMLDEAGNPARMTALDYLGLRIFSTFVMFVLSFFIFSKQHSSNAWLLILTFTLMGYMLPRFWLRRRIKKRQKAILHALPDAIDMLTIGVEAGLSFEASMLKVSTQWDNELTHAFRRAVTEIRLGTPRAVALQHMADRSGVQELRTFVAILNQSVQLGISIANVLRSQAEDMRQQRRLRAEELAHQATVKMVFPLVFLIFPALFVVILGPAISIFMNLFSASGP